METGEACIGERRVELLGFQESKCSVALDDLNLICCSWLTKCIRISVSVLIRRLFFTDSVCLLFNSVPISAFLYSLVTLPLQRLCRAFNFN